jgi:hypothetical protein
LRAPAMTDWTTDPFLVGSDHDPGSRSRPEIDGAAHRRWAEPPEILGRLRQRERTVGGPQGSVPGPGQKLHEVSTPGVNYADTHHALS